MGIILLEISVAAESDVISSSHNFLKTYWDYTKLWNIHNIIRYMFIKIDIIKIIWDI